MSDDQKISQRYHGLPPEEPPRHVDEAILSAARRAVSARPAPLVVPSGRSRWYFPLAAAAVIVLAVAVTVHVQREQPDAEAPGEVLMQQSTPARKLQDFAPDPKPQPLPKLPSVPAEAREAPAPPPAAAVEEMRMKSDEVRASQDSARAEAERAAAAAAPQATEPAAAKALMGRAETAPPPRVQAAPAPAAKPAPALRRDEVARQSSSVARFTAHSPEQWLQGIADLRRQRRHEEADKELAEFRKRHPDYRISESMLEKVEKK